ncbi:MAG: RNB domain-containing ribonuclease, partial [Alphaproteobacteria bacterium]|nr:RNB domain-containing ribonuclease [Alphaproteobacteria bacterium]
MVLNKKDRHAITIGLGDRVLARVFKQPDEGKSDATSERIAYQATPIRRLPRTQRRLLGIFRAASRGGGMIEPVDRKQLKTWRISDGNQNGAKDGDLVRFELARSARHRISEARIVEALGNPDAQQQTSLIAVHAHGLPDTFPEAVLEEVPKLKAPTLSGRDDLRDVPLITIDPQDARDHDDAVFAVADDNAKNAGGFVVIVAIADVAHYVRPGSKLDREARLRANSAYFPDRVVPMLPERISNDLCSLRAQEDRPCLAVRMVFNANGEKISHAFQRAMMRSHAKLSYEQAQAAFDGKPASEHAALADDILKPLLSAYKVVL